MYTTKYTLATGDEISAEFEKPSFDVLNSLAILYFEKTKIWPTEAYLDISLYRLWMYENNGHHISYIEKDGLTYPQIGHAGGFMTVYARFMSSTNCPMIVGNEGDLERNDVGQAFEDVILLG